MASVAPISRGKVLRVKMESESDTLGIGAFDIRQWWGRKNDGGPPTSSLVFAESAE